MNFSAEIYHFKKPSTPIRDNIGFGIWGLILVLLFCFWLELLPSNGFFSFIIFLGLIVQVSMKFTAFFGTEEHSKKRIGLLEVDSHRLKWNGTEIDWNEVEKILIEYYDFKDKRNYKGVNSFDNHLSSGLENKVEILLKNKTRFEGNLFIESAEKAQVIKDVLWEVVKANEISLENAKKMLHPSNYMEHQELKKFCK